MENSPLVLGKNTTYDNEYAPSRLHRIERSLGRSAIKHLKSFYGMDIWRLYEMTYLNLNGLPKVCMGIMKVPATSKYIVESKSLKLYELSFTMTKFESLKDVETVFARDLSRLLECEVEVELFEIKNKEFGFESPRGICLEEQEFARSLCFRNYEYSPKVLKAAENKKTVSKTYYTNLFRSLCPVTAQPDHATVVIDYKGLAPDEESLLNYLVSLRNHQGFHEQCVELIFSDIMHALEPAELTVSAFFTRRGGIDINPVRTTLNNQKYPSVRFIRQ
jgi:7-cyano-7-deazaguanine reductase